MSPRWRPCWRLCFLALWWVRRWVQWCVLVVVLGRRPCARRVGAYSLTGTRVVAHGVLVGRRGVVVQCVLLVVCWRVGGFVVVVALVAEVAVVVVGRALPPYGRTWRACPRARR